MVRSTRFFLVFLFALLYAPARCLADDQWASDPKQQHKPPTAENRIIRWCSEDGKRERFASSNLQLNGYHPCGELNVSISCDAGGKRMISKGGKLPEVYKDCSVGPRIIVERKEPLELAEHEPPSGEVLPEPLSSREQASLRNDVRDAEKKQGGDLEMQLQKMVDSILNSMLQSQGGSAKGVRGQKLPMGLNFPTGVKFSDKELDEMLRYVDPQSQPALKRLLKK